MTLTDALPGQLSGVAEVVRAYGVHKAAIGDARLESFEFYCWRHTFGTRAAQSGMDRFALARLMGHSSPSVAGRYYIHVTETHVAAGFGKFVEYQTRNAAEGIAAAFPLASGAVQ